MGFLKNRDTILENDILNQLKELKKRETEIWKWSSDETRKGQIAGSIRDIRAMVLDIIKYIYVTEKNKNKINLGPTFSNKEKLYIEKIHEINNLVKVQSMRFKKEIEIYSALPDIDKICSILDHEKDHGAEFSKLSTLINDAILIGEQLDSNSSPWKNFNGDNQLTFHKLVEKYIDNNGFAHFCLPKNIALGNIENTNNYTMNFWTSASIVYNPQDNKIKIVISKNKEINKLLDYNLIKKEKAFLHAKGECSYENIIVDNINIFEFDWDENLDINIKQLLLQKTSIDNDNNFKKMKVKLLTKDIKPQWRPILVGYESFITEIRLDSKLNVSAFYSIDRNIK